MSLIHFIGMGGIGMSGIAKVYLSLGHQVQGSDLEKNELLSELERLGAKVLIGHDAAHVKGAEVVVYSSSIREDHPERLAVRTPARLLHRSQALAELCRGKFTIAVTGTHGKTTTTALVGMVLKEAEREPTIVVGGLVKSFGGNACHGSGPDIVIAADESDSSFLNFSPSLEVITNIEEEHMDHFKTVERVEESYRQFIRRLAPGGEWVGCAEDPRVRRMAAEGIRPCTLYGFDRSNAEVIATDIVECPEGRPGIAFSVWAGGESLGRIEMKILGRHNALNALAAVCVARKTGIPFETTKRGLETYEGAARRFDVKYRDNDFLIVDDYAHHPTEIRETLAAAKALKKKRLVVFFQPHRYTRTESLLGGFAESFSDCDKLIVTDIYAAGETPKEGVSGGLLCEAVRRNGHPDARYIERAGLTDYAAKALTSGDLILTMGAGDIYKIGRELSERLKKNGAGAGLFSGLRGRVLAEEALSRHTSLKIGGPAEYWIEPADAEDLVEVLQKSREHDKKIFIFGAGSNLLPPDIGMRAVVVHLAAPYFKDMRVENGCVVARAGVPNTLFIQFAVDNGFGGCEFLSGIPGNIGGAVAMNAGSHGRSVDEVFDSATVMDMKGMTRKLSKKDIPFRYRRSGLEEIIVLEAAFSLPKTPKQTTLAILEEYRKHRLKTQDLQHPSAGCMFKNPEDGCSSGKLIEDAGLKGFRVGNAQVSDKHANFMINLGGATAEDMRRLIEEVKRRVREKFSVDLETEVKVL